MFGPKNIEISQRDGFEAIKLVKKSAVLLSNKFLEGIRGERIGGHLLMLGQSRRITIERRGGGINHPFYTPLLGGKKDI